MGCVVAVVMFEVPEENGMLVMSIDDTLREFICAAHQCIYEDGRFVRDERYSRSMDLLMQLPAVKLDEYLGRLEAIASRFANPVWESVVYRFKRDLEVLSHS